MGNQDAVSGEQLNVTVKSMKTWAETLKKVLHDSPDVPNDWVEPADQILKQMTSLEEKFSKNLEKTFEVKPQEEVEIKIRIFGRTCDRRESL